ncbi:hypothetical protein B0H14DRAFT_3874633 [Mycena olivaceomarginata]|nr:hypothetical protein B0H14DRAFT_3874633 [Mycena olivaceomarginata]
MSRARLSLFSTSRQRQASSALSPTLSLPNYHHTPPPIQLPPLPPFLPPRARPHPRDPPGPIQHHALQRRRVRPKAPQCLPGELLRAEVQVHARERGRGRVGRGRRVGGGEEARGGVVQRGEGGEQSEDGGEGDARGRGGGEGEGDGGAVVEESGGVQRGEDGPFEVRRRDGEVRELGEVGGVQDGVHAGGCEREEDEGLQTR